MTRNFRMRAMLVAGAAAIAAVALPMGAASASDSTADIEALKARFGECKRVPDSMREMCIHQAQADYNNAHAIQAAGSDAERLALERAEARYRDAYAACARLIDSQKDTCRAQAQADRSQALKDAKDAPEAFAARDTQRYQAALAACKRLPSSEQANCTFNAASEYAQF